MILFSCYNVLTFFKRLKGRGESNHQNVQTLFENFGGHTKSSVTGNRTRVSWVKARYPNRWTITDVVYLVLFKTI
ncbi:hypothetical protein H5410_011296 [Solanum commersonii]|uniref:Uncharacterized protein n=1 Tax=Solanum commersonii TaxID=4109 RepID=A0A9J6AN90_SOLCO|nr:hypothetical protein H5410_011296 [Solanum commersonii]